MLHGNVKMFDVIFKKMGEESTRAVELALVGHSLFISVQKKKTILNLNSPMGTSDLKIIDRFLLTALSIFEFFDFILLKETFLKKRGKR